MYVLHISMSGIDQGHSFTSLWRNYLQKELALQLFVHLNDCSRKHLFLSDYSTSMSIWNDWLNNTYKNLFQEPILEKFSQQNQYIQHPKSKLRIRKHFKLNEILGNTLGISKPQCLNSSRARARPGISQKNEWDKSFCPCGRRWWFKRAISWVYDSNN